MNYIDTYHFTWYEWYELLKTISPDACAICKCALCPDKADFIARHKYCVKIILDQQWRECSICLEKNVNCMLECGHWFHIECITETTDSCPNCRQKINLPYILERQPYLVPVDFAPVSDVSETNRISETSNSSAYAIEDLARSIVSIMCTNGIKIGSRTYHTDNTDNYHLLIMPIIDMLQRFRHDETPDNPNLEIFADFIRVSKTIPLYLVEELLFKLKFVISSYDTAVYSEMISFYKFDIIFDANMIKIIDGAIEPAHHQNIIFRSDKSIAEFSKQTIKQILNKQILAYSISPVNATFEASQLIIESIITDFMPNIFFSGLADEIKIKIAIDLIIIICAHIIKWNRYELILHLNNLARPYKAAPLTNHVSHGTTNRCATPNHENKANKSNPKTDSQITNILMHYMYKAALNLYYGPVNVTVYITFIQTALNQYYIDEIMN